MTALLSTVSLSTISPPTISPPTVSHFRDIRGLTELGAGMSCNSKVATIDETLVNLSTYVLPGLSDTIGALSADHVIIGPVYLSKDKQHFLDTQPAVTGSRICTRTKLGSFLCEGAKDATVRELTEELGIWCTKDKLVETANVVDCKRETITFSLNVSDAVAYNPEIHRSVSPLGKDDRSKKVQVVVYGDLDAALRLVNSVTKRRRAKDTNGIGGIRIMNTVDVLKRIS
jgi:hypothetical protein